MIICIAGLKGAGKDETATQLLRLLQGAGLNARIDRFAAPLKEASAAIFGVEGELRHNKERERPVKTGVFNYAMAKFCRIMGRADEFEDWLRVAQEVFLPHMRDGVYMLSPRLFQQLLGTEFREALGLPRMFINRLVEQQAEGEVLVVADTRYPDEAAIGDEFVLVVRGDQPIPSLLEVHSSERMGIILTGQAWRNMSERTVGAWQVVLNDGTLNDLAKEVACLYSTISERWPGLRKQQETNNA